MKSIEIKNLGTFENNSGIFIISDPCYDLGTWCQGRVENVKKGKWDVYAKYINKDVWGNRCGQLVANKSDNEECLDWEHLNVDIGIDSGQVGIFDIDTYRNNEGVTLPDDSPVIDWDGNNIWYLLCCDKTLRKDGFGIISGGVVFSHSYGDGSYNAYVQKNKEGKIVGVKILFFEEEEEFEDYKDDIESENTNLYKPKCKLVGENGNIYNLVGIAKNVLQKEGMVEQAAEMIDEVFESKSYEEALNIISKYVEVY